MRKFTLVLIFTFVFNGVKAQPTNEEFLQSLFSQAFYLEQCVSNKKIPSTEIHNKNIDKVLSLGVNMDNHWDSARNGSDNKIYDLVRRQWIKVPFNKKHCELVNREQIKYFRSLNR